MLNRACIFVFSGTGMTNYVVSKIKDALKSLNLLLEVHLIENTNAQDFPVQDYDIIGIAYPVHSFNAPKIVIDFAKQLPEARNTKTFIINVAGDKSSINFASSNLLMNILKKKNYDIFFNKRFVMPSNFIVKNDEKEVNLRIERVCKEAILTATTIIEGSSYKEKPHFVSIVLSFLGRIEWIGAKRMSNYFYTDNLCDRCEICVKHCPNKNIVSIDNNIAFKKNCGLCMKCIYICPNNAIKIRRIFKFISIGSWYSNEELKLR